VLEDKFPVLVFEFVAFGYFKKSRIKRKQKEKDENESEYKVFILDHENIIT
jgi:hypothetical protein